MTTANPDLAAALKRLRLADDALRFLSEIQKETMQEASEALTEAKTAIEGLRAPRRAVQVAPASEQGEFLALASDGTLWRGHIFKGDAAPLSLAR
jgi:hypothetical protein